MKRLFILFLVVIMLVSCGCRSIVNHDIEGQDMLTTNKIEKIENKIENKIEKIENKIEKIENKIENKIEKIENKIEKIEEKLNKKSKQETPIKETETGVDESDIKETETGVDESDIKETETGVDESDIKETETGVDESEVHKPFLKYVYPLSAMVIGSSAAFIGYKTSVYTVVVGGLLVAGTGVFSGIKRSLKTSDSEE